MTYEEFIALRKARKIKEGIENQVALKLVDYLPKRYQYAHIFWSWIWMLSIPGFILVSIFVKWWIGLLLLCVVTPALSKGTKITAVHFVLEYAEENKDFFNELVKNDRLTFNSHSE